MLPVLDILPDIRERGTGSEAMLPVLDILPDIRERETGSEAMLPVLDILADIRERETGTEAMLPVLDILPDIRERGTGSEAMLPVLDILADIRERETGTEAMLPVLDILPGIRERGTGSEPTALPVVDIVREGQGTVPNPLTDILDLIHQLLEEPPSVDVVPGPTEPLMNKTYPTCTVKEVRNRNGELETLYPFAIIDGRCYYYNRQHDIFDDNLEIINEVPSPQGSGRGPCKPKQITNGRGEIETLYPVAVVNGKCIYLNSGTNEVTEEPYGI
jgi:hypothetical protein